VSFLGSVDGHRRYPSLVAVTSNHLIVRIVTDEQGVSLFGLSFRSGKCSCLMMEWTHIEVTGESKSSILNLLGITGSTSMDIVLRN